MILLVFNVYSMCYRCDNSLLHPNMQKYKADIIKKPTNDLQAYEDCSNIWMQVAS